MELCKWDAPEGDPGQSCVHLFARILSMSFSSVSIFSVCCYSRVSISMVCTVKGGPYRLPCHGAAQLRAIPSHLLVEMVYYQMYTKHRHDRISQGSRDRHSMYSMLAPTWTFLRDMQTHFNLKFFSYLIVHKRGRKY
jgi:hypothetical protein